MKYIVVTGGVVSGLGKGVTISSMGRILQAAGFVVTSIKIDPYLNVDAGTMSPFEHGEVFVLSDGGEADLDLGNYERFLNIQLSADHNITTGKIYRKVISRERRGDYLGKTVQVVPHITNEIQDWIERVAHLPIKESSHGQQEKVADICLIEVGGTVGDIESMIFLEALRQFQFRVGAENFFLCFLSLVPVLGSPGEQKSKPTQHGVKELRSLGLSPQMILCRSTQALVEDVQRKISGFCHVPAAHVISVYDVQNIYHVPLLLVQQDVHEIFIRELHLGVGQDEGKVHLMHNPDLAEWSAMAHAVDGYEKQIKIALIGKYTGLQDSYLSVIKALKHATMQCERGLDIIWVDASHLEYKPQDNGDAGNDSEVSRKEAWEKIRSCDGVVVPGGFGNRGFDGKVLAAKYCREENVPFLGICLGFQAMVVEYARDILHWEDANSTEFDQDVSKPVIMFMPEIDKDNMGGTMRLGSRATRFTHPPSSDDDSFSILQCLYLLAPEHGDDGVIWERHRHRYEVNPEYVDEIHNAGLKFVGRDAETGTRMEIAELPKDIHRYFVGCQYHPEFQSREMHPSPPFLGLILACCGDEMLASYLNKAKSKKS